MKLFHTTVIVAAAFTLAGCGGGRDTVTGSSDGVYEQTTSTGEYFNILASKNDIYLTIVSSVSATS